MIVQKKNKIQKIRKKIKPKIKINLNHERKIETKKKIRKKKKIKMIQIMSEKKSVEGIKRNKKKRKTNSPVLCHPVMMKRKIILTN